MTALILKYAMTAFLVVLISETAKRSDRLGALIASLPLVTLLTLIWLYVEKQSNDKIMNHAYYTFWYVLGTLPFFIIFPFLLARYGFFPAFLVSIIVTLIIFCIYAFVLARFDIELL